MTTAVEPHTPSRACYLRGCRQPACHEKHTRYLKEYRLTRARHGTRRVPSEPVAQHIDTLTAAGWSHRQIADAAQCGRRTIASLVARDYPTIRRDIAKRILAAQPEIDTLPGRTYVQATGTIRRVQALHAIGHTYITIAAAAGVDDCALARVLNHQQTHVTARVAQGIRRAYESLSREPGPNTKARDRARTRGWRDPQFWDDMGRIDDPTFDPDAIEEIPRAQYIADEARWLIGGGLTRDQAAAQLGVSRFYVDRSLRDHPARDDQPVAA